MAPRAPERTGGASEDPPGEKAPSYLRARFVLGVVALAVLLGFVMARLGDVAPVQRRDRTADERPAMDPGAETSPGSTNPDDCPEPGVGVPFEAAQLLGMFMAAAADPGIGAIPASQEVRDQIESAAPSPPVSRMTRLRGFAGETGNWSTCVRSYWTGTEGPMQSLDVVTVALVGGSERAGADGSSGRPAATGGRRWEITRWLRGMPQPVPLTRVVPLSFLDGSGCSRPDREVSVPVVVGPPGDRLRAALEELVSGPVGRSPTASTSVPVDLQVLEATLEGFAVRIELTRTADDDMSRCEGTTAYDQVVATAEAVAAETLGAEVVADGGAGTSGVQVEVLVDGRAVDTLRP